MAGPVSRIVTTGDPEIDRKIGGGLPLGSLALIEGGSDSGKSALSHQMIWGSLNSGHRVSLFTTEQTSISLIRQMEALGLDVKHYYLLGWLKIYPLQLARRGGGPTAEMGGLLGAINKLGNKSEGLVRGIYSLLDAIGREETSLIFVDSITGFVTEATADDVIYFFEKAKRYCAGGKTIVVTLHTTHGQQDFTITRVRSLCDAHLQLHTVAERGKLVKMLQVAKVRGGREVTGDIWGFEVEPRRGIRIIPIRKVQV